MWVTKYISNTAGQCFANLRGAGGRRKSSPPIRLFLGVVSGAFLLSGCGNKNVTASAAAPPNVQVVAVIQRDVPVYHEWVATLDGFVNAQIQPWMAL